MEQHYTLYWNFGTLCYDRGPIEQQKPQNRSSWTFSSSPRNFWSIEYNHALYWKFRTLAGLGSRPQTQMAMGSKLKSPCWDLSNEPHKHILLKKKSWLRPEPWTPRPRIPNPKPYYSNGLMFKFSAIVDIIIIKSKYWRNNNFSS
jgi:hypothetical protein